MAGEINKRINDLNKALDPNKLATEAYKFFRDVTPVKTGNARRNTHLTGDTIQGDYAYATRLDRGYSKQAPNGMSAPTERFIQDYIKKQSKG
jgi:hypothetical protein